MLKNLSPDDEGWTDKVDSEFPNRSYEDVEKRARNLTAIAAKRQREGATTKSFEAKQAEERAALEQSRDAAIRQEAEDLARATAASQATEEDERTKRVAAAEAEAKKKAEAEAERLRNYDKAAGKRPVGKGSSPNPKKPRGGSSSTGCRPRSAGFGPRFQMTLRSRLNAATGKGA